MHCAAGALALSLALSAGIARADEAEAEGAPIVVKGQLVVAAAFAWSATTLEGEDIRREAAPDFDDLLKFVPGVTVRDFGMGGVANGIVIRGFGNGGHGGDLGAVIDGIPLNEAMSHADGYVDLNVIVPLEVADLTVFRGPVSALYGNYNRGGLLRIATRKGGDYLDADAGLGSFDTADMQVALGREWQGGRLNLAGQYYLSDGWRPRSDQERQTLSGRLALDLAPGVELAVSGRYHHADANSASYLTLAQFDVDPHGIDPQAQNDGAKKHFATLRADLSVALSDTATLVTFAYGTRQDFTRWFTRPVSASAWRQREETYERDIFGAGTSLNGAIDAGLAEAPITYVAGVEMFRERTDYLFFDGLDHRRRVAPPGNDRTTRLDSLSAFAEVQAPLHRLLDLSLGLRGDRFTGGCRRNGPETGSDPCGDMNTVERLSPKVGARSQLLPFLQLRASWAEGFALPNNFVKYAVGGQALDTNVFRQTEVGAKLTPLDGMTLDAAAFRLTSTSEVRTLAPGIYENFGATLRKGLEASAEWQAGPRFFVRSVYSYTKTKITENADAALVGKQVAGVPRHAANLDARWSPVDRWTLGANWRHVGVYAVNASNTVEAPAYDLLDLSIAYEGEAPFRYRAYLRVDNVTDEAYATSVSVIGGQTVLAPGAPRGVRAGVQVSL
ncbi:MAG TPA: TonB-dependent receptor [Novosphingobium sp.]|nr:TonB-dependent receptor [Novosphingobium sp.]